MANYNWPISPIRCTSRWGWRIHPITGVRTFHYGIDLAASMNQPVHAARGGTVTWAGYNGGEGNSVHIQHDDGALTKYFHNTSLLVSRGQGVGKSQQIARAGTTGASTGVHVHFETWSGGASQDPDVFMRNQGAGDSDHASAFPGTPDPVPEARRRRDTDMRLIWNHPASTAFLVTEDGVAGIPSMQLYNLFHRIINCNPSYTPDVATARTHVSDSDPKSGFPQQFLMAEIDMINAFLHAHAAAARAGARIEADKLALALGDALGRPLGAEDVIDETVLAGAFAQALPRVLAAINRRAAVAAR